MRACSSVAETGVFRFKLSYDVSGFAPRSQEQVHERGASVGARLRERRHPKVVAIVAVAPSTNTTACFHIRRFADRRLTRCSQRGRGSSRPDVTRGRRTPGPRGGQPIGGLPDVPINRRGCMITDSRPPEPAGPCVWRRLPGTSGSRGRPSRRAEPCPKSAPLSRSRPLPPECEHSPAKFPNVSGVVMSGAHPVT
jgi:hypothetical protein